MNKSILSVKTGTDLQGNHNKRRRIKHNYESRQVLNFYMIQVMQVLLYSELSNNSISD